MKPENLMGRILPVSLRRLEEWEKARAGQGFLLLYGSPAVFRLSLWLLARPLLEGENVLILEGSNSFDPYFIARMSRALTRDPRAFLRQIRISRAFTCHQMLALAKKAPAAAGRYRCRVVVASGLSTTFYDEDVPTAETNHLFQEALGELRDLPGSGTRLVITGEECRGSGCRDYLSPLRAEAARVVRCADGEPGGIRVETEKPAQTGLSTIISRHTLRGPEHWQLRPRV